MVAVGTRRGAGMRHLVSVPGLVPVPSYGPAAAPRPGPIFVAAFECATSSWFLASFTLAVPLMVTFESS